MADRHGKLETRAATHQLVHQVDALQYEFRQGPCVDAVGGRWQARSDDLSIASGSGGKPPSVAALDLPASR